MAESYLTILLQLLSLFVLARLITPADFGLFSVASATVLIAQSLREFGVGSYLIQEEELTDHKIRTAFTITLLFAILLFLATQMGAGYFASFYGDARIEVAFRLLAINFLLMPFNSTTISLMRRRFYFDKLFWLNMSAAVAGTVTAIAMAVLGFGYLSLVWSSIVSAAVFCLGGAVYRRSEFFLKPSLIEWRSIFSFGSRVTLTNALTQVAININDLVVGRVLGLASLAMLNRALSVMNLFHREIMGALRNVAYPAFARASREGQDIDQLHTRSVTAITAVAWPFYGLMALYPFEVLRFLFGAQWDSAAPFVPYYCLAGAVAAGWSLIPQMLMAVGRVDVSTRIELIIQFMRIGGIFACAIFFAEELPFVLTLLIIYLASWPIMYWMKQRALRTNWSPYLGGAVVSGKLALIALSLPLIVKVILVMQHISVSEFVLLPLLGAVTAAAWVFGLRYLDHPLLHDPLVPARVRKLIAKA